MRPVPAPFYFLLVVVLIGCETQDMVTSNAKARFASYPDSLIAALESACAGPAQTFLRPTPDAIECREYLPPEPTAAIILTYDGTTSDLPQLVIRFQTNEDTPGYLVENDVYLSVPQKSGAPLHVRQRDPRLNRVVNALYQRSGGVPEA
ncbi:hypothetical protein [Sedimentitalea todarodis]|uniref:Lipoprotein n=1 Tax=Sedimentitalea todarodis TaxID=1631240 RepID=A0ABU3VC46_9RHOB|nr:hypothetical protein [Sedimentitalea todarodis]MDU9003750.1 hypothetical protein [Sedimentitalea todarodis]